MKKYFLLLLAACIITSIDLFAQERKDKTAVTYEEIYDEPYSVNKLFVGFQPLYGELFATNPNAGFGVEASYLLRDKADFKVQFRKTYSRHFFDLTRDLAFNNSDVENEPRIYNYLEVGGTYHVKDFEQSSKTIMYLYKNSYKGNKWASRVPLHAEVPCKVRKIYGARLGGISWAGTVDLSRAMANQGLTNADLKNGSTPLPDTYVDSESSRTEKLKVFSNIRSAGLYVGGSMSWIKNVAVNFDKYEEGVDDLMFTTYLDILFSPVLDIDDVLYRDPNDPTIVNTYSVAAVKTQSFGFRAGIEGKFNRAFSWAYGGELGYRPSVAGGGLSVLIKISFPVYSTNLDYKVESFGK